VLALVELAGPAEQVAEVPRTPTPTPAPAATAAPTAPPATTPTPTPSPAAGATPAPDLAEWPAGRTAWTLVLNSSGTREDAERLAGELAAKGVPVGILDSDDFESLGPDSFVVFSGEYPDRRRAEEALSTIRAQAGGGSPRRIVPKDRAGG
jgi:septal ring-binding cell division protein DamX